jgi:hypothetical protein
MAITRKAERQPRMAMVAWPWSHDHCGQQKIAPQGRFFVEFILSRTNLIR